MFLSCVPRFSLVLDPRTRLRHFSEVKKVGSACEEFEHNTGGVLP